MTRTRCFQNLPVGLYSLPKLFFNLTCQQEILRRHSSSLDT